MSNLRQALAPILASAAVTVESFYWRNRLATANGLSGWNLVGPLLRDAAVEVTVVLLEWGCHSSGRFTPGVKASGNSTNSDIQGFQFPRWRSCKIPSAEPPAGSVVHSQLDTSAGGPYGRN